MVKYADIMPFYEWLDLLEKEDTNRCPEYGTLMLYEIRDKLDDLPEVVRCKDCKYGELDFTDDYEWYRCRYDGGAWNLSDHFCSYGERKDNER